MSAPDLVGIATPDQNGMSALFQTSARIPDEPDFSGTVDSVAWNHNNGQPLVAMMSPDRRWQVIEWNPATDSRRMLFDAMSDHRGKPIITSMTLSNDGKYCALLLTRADAYKTLNTLEVVTLAGSAAPFRLRLPDVKVLNASAFSSDGRYLATAETTHPEPSPLKPSSIRERRSHARIRIWDILSQQELATLDTTATLVTDLAFSFSNERLAAAARGGDGRCLVWNTRTWKRDVLPAKVAERVAFTSPQEDPVFLDRGNLLLFVDYWKKNTLNVARLKSVPDNPTCICSDARTGVLAVGSRSGRITCWNSHTLDVLDVGLQHEQAITHIAFSHDSKSVLSVDKSGIAAVWDLGTSMPPTVAISAPTSITESPDKESLKELIEEARTQIEHRNSALACKLLTRAVSLSDETYGSDSIQSCALLCTLGRARIQTRELDQAETVLRRALATAEGFKSRTVEEALCLTRCNTYRLELAVVRGDFQAAETLAAELQTGWYTARFGVPISQHYIFELYRLPLAELYRETGRSDEAYKAIHVGLMASGYTPYAGNSRFSSTWKDAASSEERLFVMKLLIFRARLRLETDGSADAAAKDLEQSAMALHRSDIAALSDLAVAEEVTAAIALHGARPQVAEAALTRAWEMRSRKQGVNHPEAALTLGMRGESRMRLKDIAGGSADCVDMLKALRRHVDSVLPVLSSNEQRLFLARDYRLGFEQVLQLSIGDVASRPLQDVQAAAALNFKGVALEAVEARNRRMRERATEAERESVFEPLRLVREELARFTLKDDGIEMDATRLAELYAKEDQLSKEVGRALGLHPWSAGWSEPSAVRNQLPKDSVLVEYLLLRGNHRSKEREVARYLACVISKKATDDSRIVDLGPAQEIDELIRRLVSEIREGNERADTSHAVFQRLIAPLGSTVLSAKRWVLCPDANLWQVPWSALRIDDHRMVIEAHEVDMFVTGRQMRRERSKATGPAVIFAGPDFSNVRHPLSSESSWPELAGSFEEGHLVRTYLERLTRRATALHTGVDASEQSIKQVRSPEYLVLSTHGYFAGDPATSRVTQTGQIPLLRCGVVLSTGKGPNRSEDGLLSGLEIAGLDLRGTKVVVLSGCETAVGEIHAAEGIAGLHQAFHLAGADAVIGSMWPVSDQVAVALMKEFFEQLNEGMEPPRALRTAQLSLMRSGKGDSGACRHWAGWVITGNTESVLRSGSIKPPATERVTPLQQARSSHAWVAYLLGAAVLMVSCVVIMRTRTRRASPKQDC